MRRSDAPRRPADAAPPNLLSRRSVMLNGTLAAFGLGLPALELSLRARTWAQTPGPAAATANLPDPHAFHGLAELLVARPLDAGLTERAGNALAAVDPSFPAKSAALGAFIAAGAIRDTTALKGAAGFDAPLKETAMKIIACLYQGFAGTPARLKATDNVRFVTYTQALMYQANSQYVPIPSYSHWGPGFWAVPPQVG